MINTLPRRQIWREVKWGVRSAWNRSSWLTTAHWGLSLLTWGVQEAIRDDVPTDRREIKEADGSDRPKATHLSRRTGVSNYTSLVPYQVPITRTLKQYVLLHEHSWCF